MHTEIIIRLMNFEFFISFLDCSDTSNFFWSLRVSYLFVSSSKKHIFFSSTWFSLQFSLSLSLFFHSSILLFVRSLTCLLTFAHITHFSGCWCCRCFSALYLAFFCVPVILTSGANVSYRTYLYAVLCSCYCITLCMNVCHVAGAVVLLTPRNI